MTAKILSDMCKPDGLLVLGPEHLGEFLSALPVERLWGVGRVMLQRLHELRIHSVGELAARDVATMRTEFGLAGMCLRELANGIDPRPVIADWQRKSYGEENTFDRDLDLHGLELRRALIAHGDAIGRRLRADAVRARTITLKLKLARPLGHGRFPIVTRSSSLEHPTDDSAEISKRAIELTAKVKEKDRIRLAGVQVHKLERADEKQLGLFDATPGSNAKREKLNRALDALAERFGDEAVTRGLARAERASPTHRIK